MAYQNRYKPNPYRPERPTNPNPVKKKSSVGWCILWFFIGMLIPIGTVGVAAGLVPIGTLLNLVGLDSTQYVSDTLATKSLLGLISYVPQATFGDVPYLQTAVTNYLNNSGFGKYVSIDWASINKLTFGQSGLSEYIGNSLTLNISIENLVADGFLKGIDENLFKISSFSKTTWYEAGEVDPKAEGFVPGLYYYDTTEDDGDSTNAYYAMAFDANGNYVDGCDSSTKLYLVNMYKANLLDCMSVFVSRLQLEKASDLVNALSSTVPENSLITKLVGDRTIGELATISAADIYLADLIESTEENQQMRDVITSWMGTEKWEDVTLEMLTDGSRPITNIKLSAIIDRDDPGTNTQLVEIIESMINDTEWNDITIGQLMSSEYSTDNIKLSIFLPKGQEGTNQEFINVIESMINDKEYEDVTLGDLTSDKYSFQNVLLNAVMPKEDVDPSMVSTLESVTKKTYEEITVSDLQSADINELALSAVIEYDPDNPNPLYNVLCDITGITDPLALTVGDLSNIENFDGLHLSTVIEYEPLNPNPLYDVLMDLTGTTDPEALTVGDLGGIESFDGLHLITVLDGESALFPILIDLVGPDAEGNPATKDSVTIGDLSNIRDFGGLHLSTVMDPYDETGAVTDFYQILMDVTNTTQPEDITISNLETADFGLIRLSRVLPTEENADLYKILVEATGNTKTADEITVGDLQDFNMDNVKLTTVMPYKEDVVDPDTGEVIEKGNSSFYDVLVDMTWPEGAETWTRDDITISSLSTADPTNISVFSILDPTSAEVQSSSFLRALHTYSPDVKVSNIGSALNALPLSEVYGDVCWTQNPVDAVGGNGGDVYVFSTTQVTNPDTGALVDADLYTYSYTTSTATLTGDQWYISRNAGCWLIFCNDIVYDTSDTITNPSGYQVIGRPVTVTQDPNFTLANMESSSSETAYKITHTTIHTMILTGLMTDGTPAYSNEVRQMTIEDMLDFVNYWIGRVGSLPTT